MKLILAALMAAILAGCISSEEIYPDGRVVRSKSPAPGTAEAVALGLKILSEK